MSRVRGLGVARTAVIHAAAAVFLWGAGPSLPGLAEAAGAAVAVLAAMAECGLLVFAAWNLIGAVRDAAEEREELERFRDGIGRYLTGPAEDRCPCRGCSSRGTRWCSVMHEAERTERVTDGVRQVIVATLAAGPPGTCESCGEPHRYPWEPSPAGPAFIHGQNWRIR